MAPFFSVLSFAAALVWCWLATQTSLDPDRFYHLMLAREWAASTGLFLASLPSVDALGWADFFPDKEPLFHVLTGILQQWGGERAVMLLPALLAGVLIWVLARLVQSHAGVGRFYFSVFLVSLGLLFEPWFFYRLSMLRPHGLAIVLFFALLLQVRRRSLPGVVIASAAFALAYHAVYLPLVVLVAFLGIELYGRPWREWRNHGPAWRIAGAGVLGLVIGVFGSPSFPGNVLMAWRHLQIALFEAPGGSLNFGMELLPWSTDRFLLHHLGTLVALGLATRESLVNASFARSHKLLLVLGFVFFVLSMQSPRAQEYLFPLVLIVTGSLVLQWGMLKQRRTALVVLGTAFMVQAALTSEAKPWKPPVEQASRMEEAQLFRVLKELPQAHPRIFNVEWDGSPQVLYARPDARVVDLLDPSFLAEHDRELHDARLAIIQGRMVDIFGFLFHRWQADYLLTRNDLLRRRLEQDPHFERIHPQEVARGSFALYRLNREARRNFVASLGALRGASGLDTKRFGTLDPRSREFAALPGSDEALPKMDLRPVYHDLSRLFSGESTSRMRCALADLPRDELARLRGRTILAIGGGRNVRIWRNGRPLYHSIQMSADPQISSQLVDLHQPLEATDRFEVLVCSLESSPVLSVSLSFWSESEVQALCDRKSWSPPETLEDRRSWSVVGRPRFTCLGDFAMPALQTP
jgi:hypothetical protein